MAEYENVSSCGDESCHARPQATDKSNIGFGCSSVDLNSVAISTPMEILCHNGPDDIKPLPQSFLPPFGFYGNCYVAKLGYVAKNNSSSCRSTVH